MRSEVGLRPVAQDADHGAHLLERPRRRFLDCRQRGRGTVGVGGGHDAAGLSLDGDGRDVVADGVMELAGQLVALTELGLLDVADPDVGVEADRRTERGGEQEEPVAGDHLGGRSRIGDVGDGEPGQDDREADGGLAA